MQRMNNDDLITSRAHEVVQCLPLHIEEYTCVRCGVRGTLQRLFGDCPDERCTPHAEFKSSGWKSE
jgi:hypothetical protein